MGRGKRARRTLRGLKPTLLWRNIREIFSEMPLTGNDYQITWGKRCANAEGRVAVVRNVARGFTVRFTSFDQPQRILSSLWIVLLLSMVFVQPCNVMYPQLVFCAGLGDGSCGRGQSVFVRCFLINTLVSLHTPWWLRIPKSLLSSSTSLVNCMFGLTEFRWL